MRPDLRVLEDLIRQVSKEELMPRFLESSATIKADGSLVTEADLAVQARLTTELSRLHPEALLLGEEMDIDRQTALAGQGGIDVWCLDPLDGTNNFASGFPCFCISLALLREGQPQLGIVYDPTRDECFSAQKGVGATLNGRPLLSRTVKTPLRRAIAMIDFKRLPKALARGMAERPPVSSWRYLGAGALEWCWLAAGRFDAYLHGGQKLWDFAAGALILEETGGCLETLDGGVLFEPGVLAQSVVAAPDPEFFALWRTAIAERFNG
jgi:myo-inositol-1(or 4)-monophosphatase